MSDQVQAVFGKEMESGSTGIAMVMVEQQFLGSTVWAALAPLLEDLGQAMVAIGVDRLPVLERCDSYMARFGEEARHHLFCNSSVA